MVAERTGIALPPRFVSDSENSVFWNASQGATKRRMTMNRLLSVLGLALLVAASAIAQQSSPTSNSAQAQSGTQQASGAAGQNESANPKGGSPDSSVPGRVTGDTPTKVQEALNKQLPAGHQVTASVTDDGSIKLTGTVNRDDDKKKAEQIAAQSSNRKVINKIEVVKSNADRNSRAK